MTPRVKTCSAHVTSRRSLCAGLRSGPEKGALAACLPKRGRGGPLVPAQKLWGRTSPIDQARYWEQEQTPATRAILQFFALTLVWMNGFMLWAMFRLDASAAELLKFQSFGWFSTLALLVYQVHFLPGPTCLPAHLLATIAAHAHTLARRILRPRRTSSGSPRTKTRWASCSPCSDCLRTWGSANDDSFLCQVGRLPWNCMRRHCLWV